MLVLVNFVYGASCSDVGKNSNGSCPTQHSTSACLPCPQEHPYIPGSHAVCKAESMSRTASSTACLNTTESLPLKTSFTKYRITLRLVADPHVNGDDFWSRRAAPIHGSSNSRVVPSFVSRNHAGTGILARLLLGHMSTFPYGPKTNASNS